jgi:divalent metal cation (Fe/Co/Zn/Cd) transporter
VWALLVGISAVVSGAAAHSLSLVGFGLEAMIDGTASAVLAWHFRVEPRDSDRAHRVEHVAHRLIGITLAIVAAYTAAQATRSLVTQSEPSDTTSGAVLAAASLVVLPVLAVMKLRLAAHPSGLATTAS